MVGILLVMFPALIGLREEAAVCLQETPGPLGLQLRAHWQCRDET